MLANPALHVNRQLCVGSKDEFEVSPVCLLPLCVTVLMLDSLEYQNWPGAGPTNP